MNSLESKKFALITNQEMRQITGGKKVLDYIECIGTYDNTGKLVASKTIRHYIKTDILGKVSYPTSDDKSGDIGSC